MFRFLSLFFRLFVYIFPIFCLFFCLFLYLFFSTFIYFSITNAIESQFFHSGVRETLLYSLSLDSKCRLCSLSLHFSCLSLLILLNSFNSFSVSCCPVSPQTLMYGGYRRFPWIILCFWMHSVETTKTENAKSRERWNNLFGKFVQLPLPVPI
jgi:hypothetical protein